MTTTAEATIVDLFTALWRHGETISICHQTPGQAFVPQLVTLDDGPLPAFLEVAAHNATAHVWHGVNPVRPGIDGRGTAADVTRLAALWADLDVKPGAMPDLEAAHAAIDDLSTMLDTRPTFVVATGGGLHPYWIIDGGDLPDDVSRADARAVLARWGRLVGRAARVRGADRLDNVYDLPRVLRTPGTTNRKLGVDAPVTITSGGGYALDLAAVVEVLTAYGVDELPGDRDTLADVVAAPNDWPAQARQCAYVNRIVDGLPSDGPLGGANSARHPWAVNQAVRLAAARRLGCLDDSGLQAAANALQARLDVLRSHDGRRPGEVAEMLTWAVDRVSRMPQTSVEAELSDTNGKPHAHGTPRITAADAPAGATPNEESPRREGVTSSGQQRIADMLASRYADHLLHAHGIGWHYWDGRRWAPDIGNVRARQSVHAVLRDAWTQSLSDADLRKAVTACQSDSAQNGILGIAAVLEQFAVPDVDDLDADPYLLNTANGTLDLRTLELRPHNPADRITKITRAAYHPNATSPEWSEFLDTALPDQGTRAWLQRLVGQALVGIVREHVLACLNGGGGNGKGTWRNALRHSLGDYVHEAPVTLFMDTGRRGGEASPDRLALRGTRLVFASETDDGAALSPGAMKTLTGGDPLPARGLWQHPVTLTPTWTITLLTNHRPKVPSDDEGVWRRLRVVPFTQEFRGAAEDVTLGERLQLAADAILAWAIDGLRAYETERLAMPPAIAEATASYREESDPVGRFLDERCERSEEFIVPTATLWEAFVPWAKDEGVVTTRTAFGLRLRRLGVGKGPKDSVTRRTTYQGVRLLPWESV